MKIAFDARVIETYEGGPKTYIVNLANALKEIDSENTYLYFTYKRSNLLNKIKWQKAGAKFDNHIIGDTWEHFYLPFCLEKNSINIYHAVMERLPLLKFHTKYIITAHDLTVMKYPQFLGRKRFILYVKERFLHAVKKADKIISVSQNTKNELIQLLGVKEEKIKVIYEGVNKNIFRPINSSQCSMFLKNKYRIDNKFILAVGVFNPKKNIPALFSAYQILRKEGINCLLVMIGFKGWRFQEILESAKDKNIVVIEGVPFVDLPYFYSAAEIFVFPSLYEGFGLPLLEAMACGTPIAASNTSSIPEVVGGTALLFDPLNVDEMAHTMKKILKDSELQQSLRKKGLERVKSFSWEKCARETLKVYKEILI